MMTATGIDHLIYACPSLQRGIAEIEELLGVRPVPGGRHPQYGTHNALLSLGPGTYLEMIARDPDLPSPAQGAFVDIPAGGKSRLLTSVFRVANIQESSEALKKAGIDPGPIQSGHRQSPDGSVIRWELTDPYAERLDGAIPFLINWGRTIHPSEVAPTAGRLVELVVEHPDADRVRRLLAVLGAEIEVIAGERFVLSARVATRNGLITLQ